MVTIAPSTRVVCKNVRLSYAHVWEPAVIGNTDADPKYSASIIIPKTDKKLLNTIEKAVNAALEEGKSKKFGGKIPPKGSLKLPLRDGDLERDEDENYQNAMFFNCSSKTPPNIVDQQVNPILDRTEVYSGCYANVSVTFYAFNVNGNRGVAAGLGNIQKVRDGEPLGGARVKAEDEFETLDFETDDDDFLN